MGLKANHATNFGQIDIPRGITYGDIWDMDAGRSFSFWYRHPDGTVNSENGLATFDGDSTHYWGIYLDTSEQVNWRMVGGTTTVTMTSSSTFGDTNWHHVCVVSRGNADHELFVDGTSEATHTGSYSSNLTVAPSIRLAQAQNASYTSIKSEINTEFAEVAYFTKALVDSEVASLSNGASAAFYSAQAGGGDDGLHTYHPLRTLDGEASSIKGQGYFFSTGSFAGESIGFANVSDANNHPAIFYPDGTFTFGASPPVEHNPVDSIAISFDSMASIDNEFNPVGTIPIAFDSVAQIAGGIINPVDNLPLSFSALANIVGDLFNPVDDIPISFDSDATIVGDLRNPIGSVAIAFGGTGNIAGAFNPSDLLSISFNSSASITFGNVVFKWSTEHVVADTSLGRPIAYVDINSETQPTGAFPTGVAYDRRLISMPTLSELNLTSRSGITGFQRLTIEVDNADGILNGLDLQSAFIRIIMVNESGTVINEFKGVIVDWVLGVVSVINMEDLDAVVFEGQI